MQLINFKLKVADLEAANSRLKGEKDQIEKKAAESLSASNLSLSTLRRELEKKQRQSQLPQIDESQLTQSFQQLGLIDPQEESPVDLNEEHGSWFGEALRTVKSASLFHISRKANQYWYGDSITFDTINKKAGAERPLEPKIVQDKNGKILAIDDAKAPLVLGTIFENESHIQQIKKKSNVEETDAIGIYTLTRDFENYLSGLSQAVQNNAKIVWHKYPTTDYTAPAFINLMRAVRDLDTRDERGEKLAYVHCKAGRGRSAVTVAAYLMHVCNLAKTPVTLEQIELYMKEQRPQVSLNHHHKQMLQRFNTELEQSRSFRDLYKKYSIAIEKQDAVIDQYYSSNASSRPPVPAPEIKALEHKQ